MKLYVFGDSFSASTKTISELPNCDDMIPLEKNWIDLVHDGLGVDEQVVLGFHGANNEIIYGYLRQHMSDYKEGDYIIIQTTSAFRKWFFHDRLSWTNYWQTNFKKEIGNIFTKEEVDAVEKYKKYLFNETAYQLNYEMFVNAVFAFAQNNAKYRVLILPAFHNTFGVNGTLQDVCVGEFTDKKVASDYYEYHGVDPRPNHMSKENHTILANKILDFFKKGETIDLDKGFYTKFITRKNYKEKKFIEIS